MTRRTLPARPLEVLGIGSLPHLDPARATSLVLEVSPDLPASPQLHNLGEDMLAQMTPWLPSVLPGEPGRLRLAGSALGEDSSDRPGPPWQARWSGLVDLLERLAGTRADRRPPLVKTQVVGPATLARSLEAAGFEPGPARVLGAKACRAAVAALRDEVAAALPGVALLVVLDEPLLEEVDRDTLAAAVAWLGSEGLFAGVHCCGPSGVAPAVAAEPDVVSVPLDLVSAELAGPVADYVDGGGWVAWGVLDPRGAPDVEEAVARLGAWWSEHPGPAWPESGLVGPDCGLGLASEEQAAGVLRAAAEVGRRLAERSRAA